MLATPQFGEHLTGRVYRDRPAAFGLLVRDRRLALVRIEKPDATYFDLPGGGVDDGESPQAAVVREFGEETGLRVAVRAPLLSADQYFLGSNGAPWNNRCRFYVLDFVEEAPSLKIEDDHTLVWLAPDAALTALRLESQAWAVAAWLRGQAPAVIAPTASNG